MGEIAFQNNELSFKDALNYFPMCGRIIFILLRLIYLYENLKF